MKAILKELRHAEVNWWVPRRARIRLGHAANFRGMTRANRLSADCAMRPTRINAQGIGGEEVLFGMKHRAMDCRDRTGGQTRVFSRATWEHRKLTRRIAQWVKYSGSSTWR